MDAELEVEGGLDVGEELDRSSVVCCCVFRGEEEEAFALFRRRWNSTSRCS